MKICLLCRTHLKAMFRSGPAKRCQTIGKEKPSQGNSKSGWQAFVRNHEHEPRKYVASFGSNFTYQTRNSFRKILCTWLSRFFTAHKVTMKPMAGNGCKWGIQPILHVLDDDSQDICVIIYIYTPYIIFNIYDINRGTTPSFWRSLSSRFPSWGGWPPRA